MTSVAKTTITLAQRSQEWLRMHPRVIDVLFAVLIALVGLADLFGEDVASRTREPDLLGVVLVLVASGALIWRRRAPTAVLVFVVAVCCLFYTRDYGSFMAMVGLAAFYSITVHEENRRLAWTTIGVGFIVLFGVACFTLLDGVDGFRWSDAVSMILTVGIAVVIGAVIRNKDDIFTDTQARAERAEADRQVEAERAVTRERLRIAREMHDVVAHGMSLITVQAAAAQEIVHSRPDDAARLMQSVETTSRNALGEMRRMLGVLRNDDPSDVSEADDPLAPQPSLAELDSVIAHCVEAGTPTELVINGDRRPLSPGVELAAFRIVQEALTNVVKHGGSAATAAVELRYDAETLRITVSDTGRGAVSELSRSGGGHGIMGMRERIDIYDGHLIAGPRPGGGYRVEASLPIGAVSDPPTVVSVEPEHTARP